MMKTGLILLATSAYGLVCQSSQSKRLVALPSSKLKNGANLAQLPLNDVTPVNPELDGVRKAFALFNQGLIDRKEVAEYAARLSFVERERLNAKAAAEARQRERVVQLERLATGCLLMASGVGMLASKGVSMVIKAGSELIGGACVSAMQAAKTSVEGAGDAAKRAAGDAVNSAIDVSIDFLFRAPVRKVQETMVQVATAPGRRAAEAIRAPVVQAEQGVNSTKAKIAATADAVSRAVKAAPQDIRSTANIAELVARGTAKFATEAVQEQRARGKINRQKAVDALDQDASQQPLQDTSTSTSSSLFRQDEIIVDGTLPEDALVDTFRAMAKWTALKAKETACVTCLSSRHCRASFRGDSIGRWVVSILSRRKASCVYRPVQSKQKLVFRTFATHSRCHTGSRQLRKLANLHLRPPGTQPKKRLPLARREKRR